MAGKQQHDRKHNKYCGRNVFHDERESWALDEPGGALHGCRNHDEPSDAEHNPNDRQHDELERRGFRVAQKLRKERKQEDQYLGVGDVGEQPGQVGAEAFPPVFCHCGRVTFDGRPSTIAAAPEPNDGNDALDCEPEEVQRSPDFQHVERDGRSRNEHTNARDHEHAHDGDTGEDSQNGERSAAAPPSSRIADDEHGVGTGRHADDERGRQERGERSDIDEHALSLAYAAGMTVPRGSVTSLVVQEKLTKLELLDAVAQASGGVIREAQTPRVWVDLGAGARAVVEVPKFGEDVQLAVDVTATDDSVARSLMSALIAQGLTVSVLGESE